MKMNTFNEKKIIPNWTELNSKHVGEQAWQFLSQSFPSSVGKVQVIMRFLRRLYWELSKVK